MARSLSACLAALAALFSACVDDADGVSVYISGHVAPDDECTVSPDNALISSGRLDLSFEQVKYELHALYINQLLNRSSTAPPRPDPNPFRVEGAVVRVLDADRNPLYGAGDGGYTVDGTTTVPSGGTDGPGRAVGDLRIIPPSVSADLLNRVGQDGTIYASVEAFGRTLGDTRVRLDAFLWPIQLCFGCLRACADSGSAETTFCYPGQDNSVPVDDCS